MKLDNEFGAEEAKQISDELKRNTTMTVLNLSWNERKNNLSQLNDYWSIDSVNKIEDEGAIAIGEALESNTTLTVLNLKCE